MESHKVPLDFFIPHDTGFILFTTMAIGIGLSLAAFWAWYTKRHDTYYAATRIEAHHRFGRHLCNSMLLLSFEACISLLTWSSSMYPMSYVKDEDEPLLGIKGTLVATVFLWCPLMCVTDFIARSRGWVGLAIFLSTMLFMLPGTTMLAVYCKQAAELESYNFYGAMNITDVVVSRAMITSKRIRGDDYIMNFGKPSVEWNCPSQSCESAVFESDCILCEGGSGFQNACQGPGDSRDAEMCVARKYGLLNSLLDNPEYQDWRQPQDTTESTLLSIFYGSCENCDAMETESFERQVRHAESLKRISVVLILSGLCTLVLLCIISSASLAKQHRGEESDGNQDSDEEYGDHQPNEESSQVEP